MFNLLDLLYPKYCGICNRYYGEFLCNKCRMYLNKIAKIKINNIDNKDFMYIFKYEDLIRKQLIDYKFNEKAYLYNTYIEFILKSKKIINFIKNYDIIIPVPISKKRMYKRGYNQTALIAKKLAKNVGLSCLNNVLLKIKDTPPQSTLSKIERIENVKNAYKVFNKDKIINKKILLLDDIYTTGNTIKECSKVLRKETHCLIRSSYNGKRLKE